jgi:hypothetical protein
MFSFHSTKYFYLCKTVSIGKNTTSAAIRPMRADVNSMSWVTARPNISRDSAPYKNSRNLQSKKANVTHQRKELQSVGGAWSLQPLWTGFRCLRLMASFMHICTYSETMIEQVWLIARTFIVLYSHSYM